MQSDHLLAGPLADELVLGDGFVSRAALVEAAVVEVDEVARVHLHILGSELLHRLRFGQADYGSTYRLLVQRHNVRGGKS
jgi:hypothetical protein